MTKIFFSKSVGIMDVNNGLAFLLFHRRRDCCQTGRRSVYRKDKSPNCIAV